MEPLSVLVTSGGAAPAVAVLRALRQQPSYPVSLGTVDMQPHSVGKFMSDWFEVVPPADNPDYVPVLLEICRRRAVHYVYPIIDEELPVWAAHRSAFESAGVRVFVNPVECVGVARDKRLTVERCHAAGLPLPRTYAKAEALALEDVHFPLFGKPRKGRGSVGARALAHRDQLQDFLDHHPDGLVQELLRGEEYTVDLILDDHGDLVGAVPKRRLEIKAGMATRSRTETAPEAIALALRVAKTLGVRGAANVQMMRDAEGGLRVIELNPKFAASLPLTVAAGFNIPEVLLQLARREYTAPRPVPFRDGLLMLRCWQEHFIDTRSDVG